MRMPKATPTQSRLNQRLQQLVDEALARITVHSPDWTNFNASDPGITLVQLLAFLAESLLDPPGQTSPDEQVIRRRICAVIPKRQRRHRRVVVVGSDKPARAATVRFVAAKLGLDLYRIDLSACRSKYVDETGKNLRPIFDAAEAGRALLFFDEADALFGKRSDVKDSHDRFANLEANDLLQRLETFDGIAVLAVKESESIDAAELRHRKWLVYPLAASATTSTTSSPATTRRTAMTAKRARGSRASSTKS